MKADLLIERIKSKTSDAIFAELYGKEAVTAARKRYLELAQATVRDFPESKADLRIFTAAGRTELGGNHTDHNHGKVLAASIQLDAVAFVTPGSDTTVRFRSTGYPDVVVDVADLAAKKKEAGTTEALVRGIAAEFAHRGIKVRGFTANASSNVLPGSGLSSSAAMEVLFGKIFDCLYGNGKMSAVEIAQIGQKAENVYFGKPCGLMDQVACASGGAVAIDFADPSKPIVKNVDFDLEAAGYALCVVNTGGNHADLTADYAAVPAEMKAVAATFGKATLREVSREELLTRAGVLRTSVGDRALLRAFHFHAENDRVDGMLKALKAAASAGAKKEPEKRDAAVSAYLRLVGESGDSSWELLQNVFTPKFPTEQGVSLALALTEEFFASLGAKRKDGVCRVHGGGFAGTIQAYVPLKAVAAYVDWMGPVFGADAVKVLRIRPVGAAELRF
jgi:galactokinase